jgi:hypothetical protein
LHCREVGTTFNESRIGNQRASSDQQYVFHQHYFRITTTRSPPRSLWRPCADSSR